MATITYVPNLRTRLPSCEEMRKQREKEEQEKEAKKRHEELMVLNKKRSLIFTLFAYNH